MKTLWRLMSYARPHWRGLVLIALTLLVTVALDVLRPWPTKLLVDHVLGTEPLSGSIANVLQDVGGASSAGLLIWACIGTVLIYAARAVVGMVNAAASVTLGQRMVYRLAADVFWQCQRHSLLYHSRRQLGDLVHRITVDSYCVQVLIGSTLLPLAQSLLSLAAMFVIMWQLEPTLTLVSMSVVPFLLALMWAFSRPMKDLSRKRRDLEGRMMALVEQTLGAIPAVQAFTREECESDRFQRTADAAVAAYRRSTFVDVWFKLLVGLVTALGTAAVMWLGGTYALEGHVTVGTILIFLAYLTSLYEPLNSIVYTASLVQYAAAGADRVREVLDAPVDVENAPGAREVQLHGHICFRDVTFGYGSQPVLRNICLEVRRGETIAVVGPTGAGKTTLVSMLPRFFDPWSGQVTIDGHDVRQLQVRSLRAQIAIVLQDPFLLPLSVADNLAYGRPGAAREEIIEAAKTANADAFIRQLPEGYDTIIGERGATLSGGEKQRLAIARAILKSAPILVLDEPTSALDARTEALLMEAVARLMAGRTTLIIAHRLSTIRNADRIVVLDGGRIVEVGRHAELVGRDGLYARLYHQQMEIVRHDGRPLHPELVVAAKPSVHGE